MPARARRARLPALVLAGIGLGAAWVPWQWRRTAPVAVAVGVDLPAVPGAAINPSDRHTADLFVEEHPRSRIRPVNHFNALDPASGPTSIAALKRQGVRFFINTQASSHAVPSLKEFSDGEALAINVSATSNRLSGHDDFFLRVVPDVTQEQRAIARLVTSLPGRRLLVLQDTSNRAYTDPAFAAFNAALGTSGRWQVTRHALLVSRFDPSRDQQLLAGQFDAFYLLAGSFLPMIGNIAQLFHQLHPQAPILLTPWANAPAIVESAGPASDRLQIASLFPSRAEDGRIDAYLRRFEKRFGYRPYAMGLSTRQALEILDQALGSGASTPAEVKRYLLSRSVHRTSFGMVHFDAAGDVIGRYYMLRPDRQAPP